MKSVIPIVAVSLAACSASIASPSSTLLRAPSDSFMLRVTNSTGSPIDILGYPAVLPSPGGPAYFILGSVAPGTSCQAIQDSLTVRIMPFNTGIVDTLWTVRDSLSIVARNSNSHLPVLTTGEFVAASASGWSVAVPGIDTLPRTADPCSR